MSARSLIGTPVTDKKRIDDLILKEFDPRYNRTTVQLTAGTYEIGQVLVDKTVGTEAQYAQPTFSDVLCCENVTVPSGETWDVAVLARGPALVNFDAVKRSSDSETDSQLRTRLADLLSQGVRFVREPVHQEESDRTA